MWSSATRQKQIVEYASLTANCLRLFVTIYGFMESNFKVKKPKQGQPADTLEEVEGSGRISTKMFTRYGKGYTEKGKKRARHELSYFYSLLFFITLLKCQYRIFAVYKSTL